MGRLLAIAFLACVVSADAETLWVAQSSAGANDGSSAANAKSVAWLNIQTNWGAGTGKVGPGDTITLSGTITNSITAGTNGTAGSPITILFDTGAAMIAGVWTDSGAINLASMSYITVDGALTGKIQCTDNGTTKGNQLDATGVNAYNSAHIAIQRLTVTNMYERTPGSLSDGNRLGYAIKAVGVSDLTINSNNLWGGDTMVAATWGAGHSSNWIIQGNTIGGCNHGLSVGTSQESAYLNGVKIHSNRIDNLNVWDGNSDLHLDGIILFVESANYDGWISNLIISANLIGPKVGVTNTGAIFFATYRPWQVAATKIVNNVLTQEEPFSWSNGFIAMGACTNTLIANNTMYSTVRTGIGISCGGAATLTNNLFYSIGTVISIGSSPSVPPGFKSDRNLFWNWLEPGSGGFYEPNYSSSTLASWRALGFDVNSITNQPTLNSDYSLSSVDTAARGAGMDLSTLFTDDFAGRTRVVPWDIGAYESGTTATANSVTVGTLIIAP